MTSTYEKGVVEVGDGLFAYLQPDGGWGWSNAGLVVDGERALLVDTLFDHRLTAEMLDAFGRAAPGAAIGTVVNTHANGDHCWGNALVPGAEIVASRACAEEMAALPPSRLSLLVASAPQLGDVAGAYVRRIFGSFDFDSVEVVLPTRAFEGSLSLSVGDVAVDLHEVGPAHTGGDVLVHVPSAGVVFTGDILFHGGHPIVWAGPVARWIAALDRIVDLAPAVVVPGHGPIAGLDAVRDLRAYFVWLHGEAAARHAAGVSATDAAREIHGQLDGGPFGGWGESERVVVNVAAVYRELGADVPGDALSTFTAMAELASGPVASRSPQA